MSDEPEEDELESAEARRAAGRWWSIGGSLAAIGLGVLAFLIGVVRLQQVHAYRNAMRFFDRMFYSDLAGTALLVVAMVLVGRARASGDSGGRVFGAMLFAAGAAAHLYGLFTPAR